jgi:hypothetical protein
MMLLCENAPLELQLGNLRLGHSQVPLFAASSRGLTKRWPTSSNREAQVRNVSFDLII